MSSPLGSVFCCFVFEALYSLLRNHQPSHHVTSIHFKWSVESFPNFLTPDYLQTKTKQYLECPSAVALETTGWEEITK
jgi:hypothetical protein